MIEGGNLIIDTAASVRQIKHHDKLISEGPSQNTLPPQKKKKINKFLYQNIDVRFWAIL